WMGALNFGRDPFFYSLYLGPLVLLLAAIGATAGRRALFWIAVLLVAIVAALGGYSPLYPLARRAVPGLMYFRFPVKYIVFAMFAGAVLAARGWAAIATRDRDTWPVVRGAAIVGGIALLASVVLLVRHDLSLRLVHWLAVSTHLKDPGAGADFLARAAPPLALRGAALLLAGCLLIAASARRAQILRVLFAAVCADLLVANGGLNPTLEVAKLSPPDWYTAAAGEARVYVGGRVRGFMNTADPDAPPSSDIPTEFTAVQRRMELNAELPMAPSGWRVREALSYDLPYLWPAAYEATVKQFERADTDARRAFLRRAGVRTCVVRESQAVGAPLVGEAPDWRMRAVECNPAAARVFIAGSAQVAPDAADLDWQRAVLFDPAAADDLVRLDRLPPAAGTASSPRPQSVRIVEDGTTRVVVEATLDRSGIVVLRDSYDDSWTAQVDGVPAALARANGLYRAVSLPPGRHVIRFAYRPRDLVTGLIISGVTALILLAGRFTRLRRPSRERGFTLIELMIVLAIIAILLAIAFNEYRGMQARGNETSALASLRSIAAAQWQFALTCGNTHYATKLPDLATPVPTTGQGFLSPDMTSAEKLEKSGYIFEITAKPLDDVKPACNGVPVSAGYAATADPAKPGISGTVFYGVNADRILYIDEEKTFTGSLPETGAPDHGTEFKK
ncbi:MAG TPA: prepilin-type N-terminal cleavage/methylation domain-containing protein, partial [Vicinamibacterales bacterium]|nr:prepilin-type N-terminal cleavage/methylation domain-containing protein [Vicinamibacterales bacterium]